MKTLALVFFFLAISSSALAQETARQRLFDAIEAGDKDTVLKLVSRRRHVNLNHRELWDGETFLIEAIRASQPEIVRILLTHGADPNLREIAGVDDEDKNLPGETPLAAALQGESTEMVQLLMQHGLKLRDNPSVLHLATSIEMVRFLLERGAPIDGRNVDGATYLQTVAADAGDDAEEEEKARLLIERGANVNIADKDGATPLLRCQSIEIAQLLIARGANVNVTDTEGMTPLHMAAFEESRIELGKLLVTHGADVNARNNEGYTPLDFLVADAFDYDFALFLVAHGARVNSDLVKKYGLEEEFEEIRKAIQTGNWRNPPS
jgi:ankyrin repeat protein